MIIALILILIGIALAHGYNTSEVARFGFTYNRINYPFYNIGLSYKGLTVTYNNGDIYDFKTLTLGLLFFEFWIQFSNKAGHIEGKEHTINKLQQDDPTIDTSTPPVFS